MTKSDFDEKGALLCYPKLPQSFWRREVYVEQITKTEPTLNCLLNIIVHNEKVYLKQIALQIYLQIILRCFFFFI